MCRVDDKPASIRLNLSLYDIAPVEDYNHRISLFINMNNPTENGLSSNEEYPILCDIEDEVIKPEKSEELCKEALKKFPNYQWNCSVAEDVKWDIYFNFLYPDIYSYKAMMNRSVIENLMKQGDNLEKEREIDHWLYFYSEESLNLAAKKVEELGYKILSSKKMEDETDTYQINISRMDNVVFNHINEVVWELVEIAESLNGYYDGWGCTVAE